MTIPSLDFVFKNHALIYSSSWKEVDWESVDLFCLGVRGECEDCNDVAGKLISQIAKRSKAIFLFVRGISSMQEVTDPERVEIILTRKKLKNVSNVRLFGCDSSDKIVLYDLWMRQQDRQLYLNKLKEIEGQIVLMKKSREIASQALKQNKVTSNQQAFNGLLGGLEESIRKAEDEKIACIDKERARFVSKLPRIREIFQIQTQALIHTFQQIREARSRGNMTDPIICICGTDHWKVAPENENKIEYNLTPLYNELRLHKNAVVVFQEECPKHGSD